MGKIYFAHPVNLYDEPLEKAVVEFVAGVLCEGNRSLIENPNQPHHQEGYSAWAARARESSTEHLGMNYFFDEVLPTCDGCVMLPFLDGRLGLGVASEGKWYIERAKPVWIIATRYVATSEEPVDFINEPQSGFFDMRPITNGESSRILRGDPWLVIPHEETRLRTWRVYGREKRPYEEAHLAEMPIPEGFYLKDSS